MSISIAHRFCISPFSSVCFFLSFFFVFSFIFLSSLIFFCFFFCFFFFLSFFYFFLMPSSCSSSSCFCPPSSFSSPCPSSFSSPAPLSFMAPWLACLLSSLCWPTSLKQATQRKQECPNPWPNFSQRPVWGLNLCKPRPRAFIWRINLRQCAMHRWLLPVQIHNRGHRQGVCFLVTRNLESFFWNCCNGSALCCGSGLVLLICVCLCVVLGPCVFVCALLFALFVPKLAFIS